MNTQKSTEKRDEIEGITLADLMRVMKQGYAQMNENLNQIKTEITWKLYECVMGLKPELKFNRKEQDEKISKVTEISNTTEINTDKK